MRFPVIIVLLFSMMLGPSCSKDRGPYVTALLGESITNFDPVELSEYSYLTLFSQTCGRLTSVDEALNIVGDLATSWDISNDYTTYTFNLDTKRKFHAGESFSSDDILFTFERLMALRGENSAAYSSDLGQIKVDGQDKIVINLKKKNPRFLYLLSHPAYCVLSKKRPFVGVGSFKIPNSNGAYLISRVENGNLFMKANDTYDKEIIENEIVVKFMPQDEAVKEFKQGKIHDLSFYLLNKNEVEDLRSVSKVIKSKIYWSWVVQLNPRKEIFSSENRRRLLVQSFDKKTFYNQWGVGLASGNSVIPEGLFGHLREAEIKKFKASREKFPCNETLKVSIINGLPSQKNIEKAFHNQISKITGCDVQINSLDMGKWVKSQGASDAHFYVFGLDPNSTDPLGYYRYFIKGSTIENTNGYDDSELNNLFTKLYQMPFRQRSQIDYMNMHNAFYRTGFGLILGYPQFDFLYNKSVTQSHMNPLGMHLNKWYMIGR